MSGDYTASDKRWQCPSCQRPAGFKPGRTAQGRARGIRATCRFCGYIRREARDTVREDKCSGGDGQ